VNLVYQAIIAHPLAKQKPMIPAYVPQVITVKVEQAVPLLQIQL
jgi:hypothetical protein